MLIIIYLINTITFFFFLNNIYRAYSQIINTVCVSMCYEKQSNNILSLRKYLGQQITLCIFDYGVLNL